MTATTKNRTRLDRLRATTAQAWEGCVDTAGLDPAGNVDEDKQREAEEAQDSALDAWDRALDACRSGRRRARLERGQDYRERIERGGVLVGLRMLGVGEGLEDIVKIATER